MGTGDGCGCSEQDRAGREHFEEYCGKKRRKGTGYKGESEREDFLKDGRGDSVVVGDCGSASSGSTDAEQEGPTGWDQGRDGGAPGDRITESPSLGQEGPAGARCGPVVRICRGVWRSKLCHTTGSPLVGKSTTFKTK